MQMIYCDNCKKKMPPNFTGEHMGYDWCGKKSCEKGLDVKRNYPSKRRKVSRKYD